MAVLDKLSPEARQKALDYKNKYNKEKYDRITILRTKGERERIKKLAEEQGLSQNEFLNKIIDGYLANLS